MLQLMNVYELYMKWKGQYGGDNIFKSYVWWTVTCNEKNNNEIVFSSVFDGLTF